MSVLSQALIAGYGSAASAADPFYSSVVLLLSMDGANGSTTFTDKSPSPRTFTANGNAQISTAQSKFGGSSGLFDGTGDWIQTPDNAVFDLGFQDFTIECFVRLNALAGAQGAYIIGQINSTFTVSSGSFLLGLGADSRPSGLMVDTFGNFVAATGPSALVINQWYHLAYTRQGSDFRLFVDGILAGSATSAFAATNSTEVVSIGRPGAFNGAYLNGYVDELRMTVGVARYTANFTPPTAPFPDF